MFVFPGGVGDSDMRTRRTAQSRNHRMQSLRMIFPYDILDSFPSRSETGVKYHVF